MGQTRNAWPSSHTCKAVGACIAWKQAAPPPALKQDLAPPLASRDACHQGVMGRMHPEPLGMEQRLLGLLEGGWLCPGLLRV